MKIWTFILVIVLLAIAAFVGLNWNAIIAPTTLSLGVAVIQAPLGFVMLALSVFFVAAYFIFAIYSKTSGFFKERDHAREMHAAQELTDHAETSRFNELKESLGAELKRHVTLFSESTAVVMARLDRLESVLQSAIVKSGQSLAASSVLTQETTGGNQL